MKYLAWKFPKTTFLIYENKTFEACMLGLSRYVIKTYDLVKISSFIHSINKYCLICNKLYGGQD